MVLAIRGEYAASARGMDLSPWMFLACMTVLPEAAMLLASLVWGRLFDRINFIALRMSINVFFLMSALVTFTGGMTALVMGSVLFGIGKGGGAVAWNLWVTKIAPPERTADYMGVHTFLTGTRGMLSVFSFSLLAAGLSFEQIGYIGAGLMLLGTLGLFPVLHLGQSLHERHRT